MKSSPEIVRKSACDTAISLNVVHHHAVVFKFIVQLERRLPIHADDGGGGGEG